MSEAYTNAALRALEAQRNTALNNLVHAEAALMVSQAKVKELESKVQELSIQPELKPAHQEVKA